MIRRYVNFHLVSNSIYVASSYHLCQTYCIYNSSCKRLMESPFIISYNFMLFKVHGCKLRVMYNCPIDCFKSMLINYTHTHTHRVFTKCVRHKDMPNHVCHTSLHNFWSWL